MLPIDEMSSSSSSSSNWRRPRWTSPPNCLHDLSAEILTSHTTTNPGSGVTDFFQWMDWPMPSTFCRNNCRRRIELQRVSYEGQIQRAQEIEGMLTEKLRLEEQEFEALNQEFEERKKFTWVVMKKIRLVVLVFALLAKIILV